MFENAPNADAISYGRNVRKRGARMRSPAALQLAQGHELPGAIDNQRDHYTSTSIHFLDRLQFLRSNTGSVGPFCFPFDTSGTNKQQAIVELRKIHSSFFD